MCFFEAAKSQSKIRKNQIFWSKGPNFRDFGSARRNARCPRRGKERLKTSPVLASFRNRKVRNRKKSLARCALPAEGAAECASAHSAGPVYGFVSLWCVGLILFSFCDQFFLKTHLRRSIPNSMYFLHNSARSVRNVPKMEPKGPNMEPTRANMEPNGPNIDQKGAERGLKNIGKSMPEETSVQGRPTRESAITFFALLIEKGGPKDRFWRSFWSHFPL